MERMTGDDLASIVYAHKVGSGRPLMEYTKFAYAHLYQEQLHSITYSTNACVSTVQIVW